MRFRDDSPGMALTRAPSGVCDSTATGWGRAAVFLAAATALPVVALRTAVLIGLAGRWLLLRWSAKDPDPEMPG
jgi:hypothetical protein